jgi:two-component system chemotaxis response regulator CheB
MGRDGAGGLRAIRLAGGYGLVQTPSSAVIQGMPSAAVAEGGADRVIPLSEMAGAITGAVSRSAAQWRAAV